MRPEQCPFHESTPSEAGSVGERCGLLKQLTGVQDTGLCSVPPDACAACCASFAPSPEHLNPVVASLLFNLMDSVERRGGVPGCDAGEAARLQRWAHAFLTKFRQPAGDLAAPQRRRPCYYFGSEIPRTEPSAQGGSVTFSCGHPDHGLTTLAQCRRCSDWLPRSKVLDVVCFEPPVGGDATGVIPVSWAVGVLAAGGQESALDWCLESLNRTGWTQARLFTTSGVSIPSRFSKLPISQAPSNLDTMPRLFLLVAEVLMREPAADSLLILSDNVVLDDRFLLRSGLEQDLRHGRTAELICLCGPPDAELSERGWYRAGESYRCEGFALAMEPGLARRMLGDLAWFECNVDAANEPTPTTVLRWAHENGHPIAFPNPPLAWPVSRTRPARSTARMPDVPIRLSVRAEQPELVSIVVPTWNCGRYLQRCLESLLRQTRPADIVVVDDASEDETASVLRGFEGQLRVVRHSERKGANAARNTGLNLASAPVVAFADADNEFSPEWLEKLLLRLTSNRRAGVAYCGSVKLFDDGTVKLIRGAPWNLDDLWFGNYIDMCSAVRRDALPRSGLPEGFRPFDDWRLWLQMASDGWVGEFVPEPLFRRRIRPEGKTLSSKSQPSERAADAAALRRQYAHLVGIGEPLAVVIPAHGCDDLTERCLTHLSCFAGVPIDVYYVDNGSPATVVRRVSDAAERLGLTVNVLRNCRNLGFTAAVNRGIRESAPAHVLVLNNDCFIGPGCLESLAWNLTRSERLAAIGPVTGDEGRQSLRKPDWRRLARLDGTVLEHLDDVVTVASRLQRRTSCDWDVLSFFCALLNRTALDRCGALDERFCAGLGADDEWCLRVRARGWTTAVATDAYAAHLHKSSFRRLDIDRDVLHRQAQMLLHEITRASL